MRALYPGSFDPLTLGHLDLIERGAVLFDGLVVAVLQNPSKIPTFPLEQRLQQIREATNHLQGVEVRSFDGLTVDELQLAHTNKTLAPHLETLFLATSAHHSFLSSSVVKEVARFGGDVSHMVPRGVAEDLVTFFNRASPIR
jgi:pantetheine-phosphate adenylyltransferase